MAINPPPISRANAAPRQISHPRDMGFSPISKRSSRPRMLLSTHGPEKTGKTYFSLTAPGLILYYGFDRPLEPSEIPEESRDRLFEKYYKIPPGKDGAEEEWLKFREDWTSGLKLSASQTVTMIQDTSSDCWRLCRMSYFGKLTQVQPYHYDKPNSAFKELINEPYLYPGANCLLIHKVKKEYKTQKDGKDAWTGNMERDGYGGADFEMQICIGHIYSGSQGGFGIRVTSSGINAGGEEGIRDMEFFGSSCNFLTLGMYAYPAMDPAEWGV